MKTAHLIFPHQLFQDVAAIREESTIYLVEEYLFFTQYNFHKAKLSFHRASMKAYETFLKKNNFKVVYVDAQEEKADVRKLIESLAKEKYIQINYAAVYDCWLQKRITQSGEQFKIKTNNFESSYFLNSIQDGNDWVKNNKRYFHHNFYIDQRKKYKILVHAQDQPTGGKWSFDEENRKKLPAKHEVVAIKKIVVNTFYKEAITYVEKNFRKNYGESAVMQYPVTFEEAEDWLQDFFKERFSLFGDFEDALSKTNHQLYHSMLSPLMNVGLLTPKYVVDEALKFASAHKIPLNNVEGFVRQIIGWREFMHLVYYQIGSEQRTKNFWGFTRKIPASFWDGSTGIEPIDVVIKEVLRTGYCHHIERLMIVGNFMLLCEFNPNEVYRWYMELFIDSYDWVMVPNVYGMSQFADGGMTTTKPYISGSNYVIKMSDYKKGEWSDIWDSLFWRFMDVHRDIMGKNPRMGMLIKTYDKMPFEKKETLIKKSDTFLKKLDN